MVANDYFVFQTHLIHDVEGVAGLILLDHHLSCNIKLGTFKACLAVLGIFNQAEIKNANTAPCVKCISTNAWLGTVYPPLKSQLVELEKKNTRDITTLNDWFRLLSPVILAAMISVKVNAQIQKDTRTYST